MIKQAIGIMITMLLIVLLNGCNSTPKHYYNYKEQIHWPKNKKIVNCYEIEGKYVDIPDDSSGLWSHGSKARGAFGFPFEPLRLNDSTVKSRNIFIHFDTNQTLNIDYQINGQNVSMRTFDTSQYFCTEEGIEVVLSRRTGQLDRVIPNPGMNSYKATIYRLDEYLYVHNRLDQTSMIFYLVPNISYTESFSKFLVKKDEER